MQKIIEQVKAYLDRTPDPCGADYLERGGTRKAILSLIDHERSNLVLLKPNQKTRSEMESLDQDIKRLGALRRVLEVEALRGKETALAAVDKDLLPELRDTYQEPSESVVAAWEAAIAGAASLAKKNRLRAALMASQGRSNSEIEGTLQRENGTRLVRDGNKRGREAGLPDLPVHPTRR